MAKSKYIKRLTSVELKGKRYLCRMPVNLKNPCEECSLVALPLLCNSLKCQPGCRRDHKQVVFVLITEIQN